MPNVFIGRNVDLPPSKEVMTILFVRLFVCLCVNKINPDNFSIFQH